MADSPAHKFGQMIGDVLEITVEPILSDFATKYGLYLDKKGPRPARKGNKVSWTDLNGNKHDLDFVLERGGTAAKRGTPVAFIETAWRRYTKHSRNKAQEIQGAIVPLCETHHRYHPFKGAVLAGVFTTGALNQLKSLGFSVAYFPYETVIQAFATVGIDASSDETTPDDDFAKKFRRWDALKPSDKAKVGRELARINAGEVQAFIEALRNVTMRTIKTVRILPLHGHAVEWPNVEDAITFIQAYNEEGVSLPIVRYEVQVIYINGDKISGEFAAKDAAIEFLKSYSTLPVEAQNAAI
jgi:hypothetical protein